MRQRRWRLIRGLPVLSAWALNGSWVGVDRWLLRPLAPMAPFYFRPYLIHWSPLLVIDLLEPSVNRNEPRLWQADRWADRVVAGVGREAPSTSTVPTES